VDKTKANRLALLLLAIVVALPLLLRSAPSNVSAAPGLTITGDVIQLWCEENTEVDPGISPIAIPDLDDDGKSDVVVRMWAGPSDNMTATLIAKRGYDGYHLWQQSITGENAHAALEGAGYLDGDDKIDLLVNMSAGPSDNTTATLIAKRGYDGHHLWQQSITGENAHAALEDAGYLDGDDKIDLLVNMSAGPSDNTTATLIVKRGYDGHHLWQESITGDNAYMDGSTAPDLDGDGKYDVLVQMRAGPSDNMTATLIAKRGYDGHHLWQESITGENAVISERTTPGLDGDGKYDVLVQMRAGPSDNTTATLIAKRGYDGHHLWQESITDQIAIISGGTTHDLDGDRKEDVLVYMWSGPWDSRTATLIAKRGYDGHHLWQESITGDNAQIAVQGGCDLEGDGVLNDVLVRMQVGPTDNMTSTVIAKRGYDGHHLWQESITGFDAFAYYWILDVDCDNEMEVIVHFTAGWGNRTDTFIAKEPPDGSHLWQWQAQSDDYITVHRTNDLDGDGKSDILIHTSSKICALALIHCPTVTSVNPAQGIQGHTLNVTITGTKFTGATVLNFGDGITVNSFTVDSDTQIRANITIAADVATGTRNVSVTAPDGVGTLTDGFTVNPAPPAPPTPPTPRASPTPPVPPYRLNPAQISLQQLSINPQQTTAGQPLTILTNVVNTGDEAGNYNVILKINGQVEQTRMVSVGPQGTQLVKFTITKAQPGTYTVNVGDQKASFIVTGTGRGPGNAMDKGILFTAAMAVISILVVLLIIVARRRLQGY